MWQKLLAWWRDAESALAGIELSPVELLAAEVGELRRRVETLERERHDRTSVIAPN